MADPGSITDVCLKFFNEIVSPYLIKVSHSLKKDQALLNGFGPILRPSSLTIYIGKYHVALEYSRIYSTSEPSDTDEFATIAVEYQFFPEEEEILDRVLGYVDSDKKPEFRIPVPGVMENLFVPLGDSLEYMIENGWNVDAQMRHQTTLMAFGPSNLGLSILRGEFGSIRNSFFYSLEKVNKLKVRHLKWVDLFPITVTETEEEYSIIFKVPDVDFLVASAMQYEPPDLAKSQLDKLVRLNRFIELINISDTDEPEITRFLAKPDNHFIIRLYFSAKAIHPEVQLKWQSRTDKPDIRPDFFVTMPNGFADIVDFKLPNLKNKPVRGKEKRKRFSAYVTEYMAQLREYRNYFDDYANRQHAEGKGVKVSKPKKFLVIGRRQDFNDDDWREILDDYKDSTIITYDDLIDAVTSAVYMVVE